MFRHILPFAAVAAWAVTSTVHADEPAASVAPAHCLGSKSACSAAPSPSAATPKIEIVMSQPEVHVVAPSRCAADKCKDSNSCDKEGCSKGKCVSLININCAKSKGPAAGARQETVTTVVPAYATATIPIALQTTRTFTSTGEFAVARREVSRADIRDAVREALAESSRQRGNGGQESAAAQNDCCSELKDRVKKVEDKLVELNNTVNQINQKLEKLGSGK